MRATSILPRSATALILAIASAQAQPAPAPTPAPAPAPAPTTAPSAPGTPPADKPQPKAPLTIAQLLAGLHTRPTVIFSNTPKWTVAEDPEQHAVWSFANPDNPFYPAVVRRTLSLQGSQIGIRTDILCEAAATMCAQLQSDLSAPDDHLAQHMAKLRRSLYR